MTSIGRDTASGVRVDGRALHVFTDHSRTDVELHVYADHLELHAHGGNDVRAVWYRHIRRVGPSRENEAEALAIIDRGGHVLVVPMAHKHVMQARWLISNLMEWAERYPDRSGARCADGDERSLVELTDEG